VRTTDDRLDRDIADALRALDDPIAPVDVDVVIRRARASSGRRRWRIAAGGALALAAATAAAAMPGSPIRRWLVADSPAPAVAAAPSIAPPHAPEAATSDRRGVAIIPGDSAEIAFDVWQPSGEMAIRVSDGTELRVRAVAGVEGGDGAPGFVVRPGGVRVHNDGSRTSFELSVPASARHVRITVDGTPVFERDGDQVVLGGAAGADGAIRVSLRRGDRR
jgi:hypothetical protein